MDMTPKAYQKYVQQHAKKSPIVKDTVLAFVIGGLICVVGQLIQNGWSAAGLGKEDAGTATSCTLVLLSALRPRYPALAWSIFGLEWALALIGAGLTAIDLKKHAVFAMSCYIGMGWAILPFWRQVVQVLTMPGFLLLLAGGIAYTIGSILYGLGKKRKWMHSVFHIFVDLGATLQFFSVLLYAL